MVNNMVTYIKNERNLAIEGMKVTILGGGSVQGIGGMRLYY